MQLDATTNAIIAKLQTKYKKEFDEDVSKEDILVIIESQFSSIPTAMKEGETVKLDKLGKFLQKEGRVKALKSKK